MQLSKDYLHRGCIECSLDHQPCWLHDSTHVKLGCGSATIDMPSVGDRHCCYRIQLTPSLPHATGILQEGAYGGERDPQCAC